jgi:phage terminase small subunit
MAKKKIVKISDKEEMFIEYILEGMGSLDAYRKCFANGYSDTKARSIVKGILNKEHIQQYMQMQILDRQGSIALDEAYIISNLKKIVVNNPNSNNAVRALELMGKKLGMWIDKQVVETTGSQSETAEQMFERRMAIEAGEEVEELSEISEKTAEILEFELYDDKNGTD